MVVDAGGFAHRGSHSDLKTRYLFRAYRRIGYQAVNLAEPDLRLGKDLLEQFAKEFGIPFLTCNLRFANGESFPFAKPYVVIRPVDADGLKVGVFGVSIASYPIFGQEPERWWRKDEPVASARKVVEELKKEKCDIIVALAYATDTQAEEFARSVPGVDVLIAGRSTYRLRGPRKVGDVILCVNSSQGKYIGDVLLNRDSESSGWIVAGGELFPLDKNVPEDPEIKKIVQEYKEALKKAVGPAGAGASR